MGKQSTAPSAKPSRAVWICYAAGVFAYVVAVFNRTSFGVAAVPAAERFQASASDIAMFTVVQLVVYAGMQIPVGVMVDRYGPRRLVITGAFMMAAGQALLSISTAVTPALLARILIGAGDALTFACVLRKVADTFPARLVPHITQLTGLLGQLGQLISAIPFAALLAATSWTTSFLAVAAHALLAGILAIAFFRGETSGGKQLQSLRPGDVVRQITNAWRHPGTRLGFWSHFVTPFSVTTFAMLWGYPFMTEGLGFSQRTASTMLTINVLVALVASPLMGRLVSRHPLRRSMIVLACAIAAALGWTLVLLWPGAAPAWTIALLMVLISLGGPGSMVGFDFARTFNPTSRLGTATGIVNVGGFFAALVTMFAMGMILDALGSERGNYSLESFKWAFAFQYVVWAIGIVMIVRNRDRTRRILAREDEIVVPPLRSALRRDWNRYQMRKNRERLAARKVAERDNASREAAAREAGRRPVASDDDSAPDPPDWQI
ncbi:nitrate/nitrite transporter [Blastococcus sp. Marseille-P5729]|uniref:MFS transporter n=1 Tax=Blastococcus sp. Marseille-P5729 TaxID=2086582 RepID=UPI000D106538|nr:MFS transporter [Blastococcus sp. Marseille-P5729]